MGRKIKQAAQHLWELMIPVKSNGGKRFTARHHSIWEAAVLAISGGLTILQQVRGYWLDDEGKLYREPMIPVRFTASAEQAKKLADLALEHYDQKAVMGNKVARCRDVIFRKRSY